MIRFKKWLEIFWLVVGSILLVAWCGICCTAVGYLAVLAVRAMWSGVRSVAGAF